jgi:hypothetical protein
MDFLIYFTTFLNLQTPQVKNWFLWYAPREKSQKAVQEEIHSVIWQITAIVTFLAQLNIFICIMQLIALDLLEKNQAPIVQITLY